MNGKSTPDYLSGTYVSMDGGPFVCLDCNAFQGQPHFENCKRFIPENFDKKQYQDQLAFDLLYNTFIEVGEILERGIRDGEKGYKNAIYKAREKIRLVT